MQWGDIRLFRHREMKLKLCFMVSVHLFFLLQKMSFNPSFQFLNQKFELKSWYQLRVISLDDDFFWLHLFIFSCVSHMFAKLGGNNFFTNNSLLSNLGQKVWKKLNVLMFMNENVLPTLSKCNLITRNVILKLLLFNWMSSETFLFLFISHQAQRKYQLIWPKLALFLVF